MSQLRCGTLGANEFGNCKAELVLPQWFGISLCMVGKKVVACFYLDVGDPCRFVGAAEIQFSEVARLSFCFVIER